jgi:RNA polymerase sigma-70 factor (ECF subfamily)
MMDVDAMFREHAAMVAGIAYRMLGTRADLEDVVQDVFLDVCRGGARIRRAQAVKSWIAVCTIRRVRRRLRNRQVRRILGLDAPADYDQIADPRASPDGRAFLPRLYQRLDALPAPERLAWTLRYIDGEDLETVARLCRCSLATGKRRIAAAAQSLAESLA